MNNHECCRIVWGRYRGFGLSRHGERVRGLMCGWLETVSEIGILYVHLSGCNSIVELNMKQRILFVCLGNICRSPAAEAVMDARVAARGLEDEIETDSAGTYGGHSGDKADPRMRAAASRRGYTLTHRARRITEEDFDRFDMIIVMDDMNYETVSRLAPDREHLNRLYRFVEFCRHHPEWNYVPDPYYEGREGFELVLDLLEDGCDGLIDRILAHDAEEPVD